MKIYCNTKSQYLIFILCFYFTKSGAQNNAIFNGGNADGFSSSSYAQPDMTNNSIFNGSSSDGFTLSSYIQPDVSNNSVFNGGNFDGFGYNNFIQSDVSTNNSVFNGGNSDGFSSSSYTQSDVGNNSVFNGGNADGSALNNYIQPDVSTNNSVFNGGIADGFSNSSFTQPDLTNNSFFNGGNGDGFAFRSLGSTGNEIPLPIELISFTGKCYNSSIILNWSTASEINNDFFTVEESKNGTEWIIVGTVKGAGNSNLINSYTFVNPSKPTAAVSWFYRLLQTDFNSKSEYSKIIKVESCKEDLAGFTIYPNPSKGIINIFYDGNKEEIHSIEIKNILGETFYYSSNYNSIIDISDKSKGIYFISYNSGTKIFTKKIIIE